jgi:ferredoxin, 2Fe-2S
MPKITFLPHPEICPQGKIVEVPKGTNVLDAALDNDIPLEHACEGSCACTTCHVIVRKGFQSLPPADELEEDLLDKAWGLEVQSRLGCQAVIQDTDLSVEIPKYTINQVSENN